MTEQMELIFAPLVTPDLQPDVTIEKRFAAFHQANPQVADALEYYACQWLAAGNDRFGVKALVERLRWESGIHTAGSAYKVNNSFVSHYARLLIERHPEWAEAIETRQLKAA